LCMAQLQLGLQHDRHLKHWGRLQYGLFLKGAGLSLEDGLQYFEKMFAKDYQKEYGYGLRHMYGKEGKRTNYPPYSCSKIINSNAPNANEHHGCPYKHGSIHEVTTLLSKLGVVKDNQKTIVAQLQSHQYQLACVEHFKAVNPISTTTSGAQVDNVGNHPNAWFHASVAHSKAAADAKVTMQPNPITAAKLVSVSP
jgi:DNA primase large subunit